MLKNYLLISYRNFIKHRAFSSINIAGLTIGMVSCILIFLFVQDELSYDKFHTNSDNIYRFIEFVKDGDVGEESASQPFPVGPKIIEDYPHLIKSAVRFFNMQAPSLTLAHEEISFNESRFFFADSSVFSVFSYDFVVGDPSTALQNPNEIVLTESMASKYFGNNDPIGKTLLLQNNFTFTVVGVIKNVPVNTHLRFDFLASFSSLRQIMGNGALTRNWYWNPCWTYLLLHDNVDPASLEEQFPDFITNYPQFIQDKISLHLQPLTDIHLHSHLDYEISANSDIIYIYVFLAIAIVVLVIACMNFMNLAIARALNRTKEIGIRKTVGAVRHQLIKQFLGESIMLSGISMVLAIIFVAFLLPFFNIFTGKEISLNFLNNAPLFFGVIAAAFLVGGFSGFYPALFLSGFKTVTVLKGTRIKGSSGARLRKGLVILQFSVSIILIAGTITAVMQLNYLQNKNLGFDKESVILVPITPGSLGMNYRSLKDRLLERPLVKNVTGIEGKPGIFNQTNTFSPEGYTDRDQVQIPRLLASFDVIETLGMEMMSGHSFTREFEADTLDGLIINEATARFFGWTNEEAINQNFQRGTPLHVVGVVKDFHYASLHNAIGPFVFQLPRNRGQFNFFIKYIAISIDGQNIADALAYSEQVWNEAIPNQPFEYTFLDSELDGLYKAEAKLGFLSKIFSSLAIFIACLGLYALASFTAEQKIKEIGIRKVLGASTPSLLLLISREFTGLIFLSNLIGLPASVYFTQKWLNEFAFRIETNWMLFATSGVLALFIAIFTISFQAFKAANSSPVESLKQE